MRYVLSLFFLFGSFFAISLKANLLQKSDDKKFVIVIPSYNNKSWYKLNLSSVFSQKYKNFHVIYIDDASSDGTGDLVKDYIKKNNIQNITLLRNETNRGCLYNVFHAIHQCKDNQIIVKLDGDDWLAHDDVLTFLNGIYQNPNVWLTYRSCKEFPSNKKSKANRKISKEIIQHNAFRDGPFVWHHLQTFYSWLFKKIQKKDLLYNGSFFPLAEDFARMLPMLEMAGTHSYFIPEILYILNRASPINDGKLHKKERKEIISIIKKMPPYVPLKYSPLKIMHLHFP